MGLDYFIQGTLRLDALEEHRIDGLPGRRRPKLTASPKLSGWIRYVAWHEHLRLGCHPKMYQLTKLVPKNQNCFHITQFASIFWVAKTVTTNQVAVLDFHGITIVAFFWTACYSTPLKKPCDASKMSQWMRPDQRWKYLQIPSGTPFLQHEGGRIELADGRLCVERRYPPWN